MNLGEHVWLKSGSPRMKVTRLIDDDKIECSWRTGSRLFHPAMLTTDDPEPGKDWSGDDR